MSSPDQFMHILTLSILCITTPQYYLQRTNFLIRNALGKSLQKVHLSSGQPDQKDNQMSCLPYVVLGGYTWARYIWVYMSRWPYIWLYMSTQPDIVPVLSTRCLYLGGTSDWMCQLGMSYCHLSPQFCSWTYEGDVAYYYSWPWDASIGGTSEPGMSDCNLPAQLSSQKCQANLTPDVILLLTTTSLYGGYIWARYVWW